MRFGGLTAAIVTLLALAIVASGAAARASALTPTPSNTFTATLEAPTSTATPSATDAPVQTPGATATPTVPRTPLPTRPFQGPPPTATPNPGLNFWISIEGVPACGTQHGDATCTIPPGSTFVIDVHLDPLPPEIPSYGGYDIRLEYFGVTANHDASTAMWPDCVFPAESYMYEGIVLFACAVGVPPAGGSTYSGVIGTNSFVCVQSGGVSLIPGITNTDLVEFDNISRTNAEDVRVSDKLTISCGPPTLPLAGTGPRRPNVTFALALAAVGCLALAGTAWAARRRRA
jgi:hypothetical protein